MPPSDTDADRTDPTPPTGHDWGERTIQACGTQRAPGYWQPDAYELRRRFGLPALDVDRFTDAHPKRIVYPDLVIHERTATRTPSNKGTDALLPGDRDSGKTTTSLNLAYRLMEENGETVVYRGWEEESGWLPFKHWTTLYLPAAADADTDGGGTDDGAEVAAGTDPTDPSDDPFTQLTVGNLAVTATTATATRAVSLPAGAEVVDLQAEVAGDAEANASVRLVVAGEGHSETVFAVTDGDQQMGQVTADLSSFAGETVTIRLATEGDAQLAVESLKLAFDRDGDGLTDAIERGVIRTGTGETIDTEVRFADTDEDGLSDAEEVGVRVEPEDTSLPIAGGYYATVSDPTVPDSDADRVNDFAERRVWGTAPAGQDTDGDGYSDLVDAEPTSDSAPPTMEFRSADFGRPVRVRVTDASGIADVELHARYVEWSGPNVDSADDMFTSRRYEPTAVERVGPNTVVYTFELERGGQLNLPPAGYYVNATDTEGNEIHTLVAVNNSTGEATEGGATVTSDGKAGVAIAAGAVGVTEGQVAVGTGSSLAAGSSSIVLTGGAAILLVASVYVVVEFTPSERTPVRYTEGTAVGPATVQGGRYENLQPVGGEPAATAETPTGEEIALRAGALLERRGHLRGFGLDYITTSTSISEADIKHVINDPVNVVRKNGQIQYIIGRGLSKEEVIILSIINGVLLAASDGYETVEDACGQEVAVEDETPESRKHVYRDVLRDDVINALKNPAFDTIWTDGHLLYYIAQASNGVWFAVRVSPDHSVYALVVGTTLTAIGRSGTWRSARDVLDYLKNEHNVNIHKRC